MGSRVARQAGALGIALSMISLAACGGGDEAGGGGASGSSTLTVAWTATPPQLDPNVFTGLTWVYASDAYMATLLEYDLSVGGPDGRVIGVEDLVPSLAESYEANEDGTQYTFRLRQGVTSPAGNELTAADVQWTFERWYSAPSSLQAGVLLPTANVDETNPIEVVDDYTFRYNLTEPSPVSLSILAYPILGVLDSALVQENATPDDPWGSEWLATNTAGFGAYQLESLNPGQELRLTRNPEYFGEAPDFSDIVIRSVPDGASRAQLLISGEVDVISEPPIDQLESIASSSTARVSQQPDTNRHNLSVNHRDPILGNAEVRRALSMAIDRQALVESVYQGYAEPALTPIASQLYEQEPTVTHDPEAARELLAQAGYPDGFDMQLSISNERPGPYSETLARLIQSDLAEIGVNVAINAVPSAADFEEAVASQSLQAYLYSERPAQPDAGYDFFLYLFSESALNNSGYANPRFDELTLRSLSLLPGQERDTVIEEALAILADEEPIISLVEVPDLVGLNNRVENYVAVPSGGISFENLELASS